MGLGLPPPAGAAVAQVSPCLQGARGAVALLCWVAKLDSKVNPKGALGGGGWWAKRLLRSLKQLGLAELAVL